MQNKLNKNFDFQVASNTACANIVVPILMQVTISKLYWHYNLPPESIVDPRFESFSDVIAAVHEPHLFDADRCSMLQLCLHAPSSYSSQRYCIQSQ